MPTVGETMLNEKKRNYKVEERTLQELEGKSCSYVFETAACTEFESYIIIDHLKGYLKNNKEQAELCLNELDTLFRTLQELGAKLDTTAFCLQCFIFDNITEYC
jgi:hypothetical protein